MLIPDKDSVVTMSLLVSSSLNILFTLLLPFCSFLCKHLNVCQLYFIYSGHLKPRSKLGDICGVWGFIPTSNLQYRQNKYNIFIEYRVKRRWAILCPVHINFSDNSEGKDEQ